MGPKKGKKRTVILIEDVNTAEMTRGGLEQFITNVKNELERERNERKYFQVERDKITAFWEITRKQLDEAKTELRNLERAKEESQEENDDLLEKNKQKLKHLQYEQQSTAATLRSANLVSLKAAKEQYGDQETLLNIDTRCLRNDLREQALAAQDEIRRAKLNHAEDISRSRAEFEQQRAEIEGKAEKKLADTKAKLGGKHRAEIEQTEYKKNKQIADLMIAHNKAFTDLKNYYNDITINNLGLITTLRQQMEEMQALKERANKIAADSQAEAKSVQEPLEKIVAQNNNFVQQLMNYAKDKAALAATSKELEKIKTQYEVLKWEYEVLKLRHERMERDREDLRAKFSKAVKEILQKAMLKRCVLETRLTMLKGKDLKPAQIQELLNTRETQVEDLRYEAARLRKAHDDLLATYEAKLAKLGLHTDEIGFQPLRANAICSKNRRM